MTKFPVSVAGPENFKLEDIPVEIREDVPRWCSKIEDERARHLRDRHTEERCPPPARRAHVVPG